MDERLYVRYFDNAQAAWADWTFWGAGVPARPAYSIAGNVGVAGVTVSAGGVTSVSNANGQYAIFGVAPGTQTVRPAKAGCLFVPAAQTFSLQANRQASFATSCSLNFPRGQTPYADRYIQNFPYGAYQNNASPRTQHLTRGTGRRETCKNSAPYNLPYAVYSPSYFDYSACTSQTNPALDRTFNCRLGRRGGQRGRLSVDGLAHRRSQARRFAVVCRGRAERAAAAN